MFSSRTIMGNLVHLQNVMMRNHVGGLRQSPFPANRILMFHVPGGIWVMKLKRKLLS